MQQYLRLIYLFLICLGLTSCISLRAPQTPSNYQIQTPKQRAGALAALNQWHINGALSVSEAGHTDLAQYTWQEQANQHYTIVFSGPLGIGQQRLQGSPERVTLTNARGQRFSANSAESLLVQQLGWHLPVTGLRYWIRNLPAPGTPADTRYDQYGHLIELKQQGWQIHYQRFQRVHNMDLPSVLLLNNPRVQVKIVVKQWQLNVT